MPKASRPSPTDIDPTDVRQRPLIGVTLMLDLPERDRHLPRYGMSRAYFDAIRLEGGVPVALAPGCTEEMLLYLGTPDPSGGAGEPGRPRLALEGLCLSGGGDLDPAYYHQEKREGCYQPEPERDQMEMDLLALVRDRGIPVLAICRGIQVLNAACGGTLIQDIASERPEAGPHNFDEGYPRDHLAHEIRVEPGSQLHEILGSTSISVNSIHHQAVDRPGEGLVATAWAPDGIIEGLELAPPAPECGEGDPAGGRSRGGFCVAVQFHPEDMLQHEPMRRLFRALVEEARRFRGRTVV